MRLFYAVELPRGVRQALARLRPNETWAEDYRWVEPELMHVTLAFLGEQPETSLEELKAIGQRAGAASQPGVLTIAGAGKFGSPRAPRVLWVGLQGNLDALNALQERLAVELRQAGYYLEDRAFSPHITLARRRQQARPGPPPPWPPAHQPGPFKAPVDQLTLFQSQLSPSGARYTPLAQFPLTGR
jgi:RNA 2',3'-cyclic 3'-phosphodiesterase